MVLMRQGRPKQRHKTIAKKLVDGAFIAVYSVECQGEKAVEQSMHCLGSQPFSQRSGVRQVAEQHRDLLALALQGTAGGEDFLSEVQWGVGKRLTFLRAGGRRGWRRG